MTYQILNTTKKRPVVDCCSLRPITFECRDDAEKFAASCVRMTRIDNIWRRPGHRRPVPVFTVVECA